MSSQYRHSSFLFQQNSSHCVHLLHSVYPFSCLGCFHLSATLNNAGGCIFYPLVGLCYVLEFAKCYLQFLPLTSLSPAYCSLLLSSLAEPVCLSHEVRLIPVLMPACCGWTGKVSHDKLLRHLWKFSQLSLAVRCTLTSVAFLHILSL